MSILVSTAKGILVAAIVIINLIIIIVNCSIWIRLTPPASALLTLPKLIYPNIVNKAIYGYFGIAVLLITALSLTQFNVLNIPAYMKWLLVLTLATLACSAISSDLYINKLKQAKMEYSNTTIIDETKSMAGSKVEFSKMIDLREKFTDKESKPLVFKLYQPDQTHNRNDLVMYLAYGNWLAVEENIADYFVKALNKEGYMAVVFTGKTRKETDFFGMIKDIKEYVAYLRRNSEELGIGRIFLSGGSAGANLALTTAYGNSIKEFQVSGLSEYETKVDGVIAFYPVVDMLYNYEFFTNKEEGNKSILDKMGDKLFSISDVNKAKSISESHKKVMKFLLGGFPEQENMKEIYELSSPTYIVNKDTPPTLLIHGSHDSMTPIEPTREIFNKLKRIGVDSAILELPFTDHAFDAILPGDSVVTKKVLDSVFEWLLHFEREGD